MLFVIYYKPFANLGIAIDWIEDGDKAGAKDYIKKIECFCFAEGIELMPGEEILLPIKMVVDDELPENIKNIVLSYTIFDSKIEHNITMDHDGDHAGS